MFQRPGAVLANNGRPRLGDGWPGKNPREWTKGCCKRRAVIRGRAEGSVDGLSGVVRIIGLLCV